MATSPVIRLIIADDHQLFLEGLQRLFEDQPDLHIAGIARNGQEAISLIQEHKPDIALLDIDMPDMNAFAVADRLAQTPNPPRIILLTMHNETPYLLAASRPDIQGFVLKDAAFDELSTAIRQVQAGERYIGSGIDVSPGKRPPLSPREMDVLRCAALGLTTRKTAKRLGIGEKTVETHRAHIINKLHVSNITSAVSTMNLHAG